MTSLLRKTLRDDRRALIGWSIGVVLFISAYLPWYPQMRPDGEMQAFIDEFMKGTPPGLMDAMGWSDFSSGVGYLGAMIYNLYIPLLVIVCAAVIGNRAIAVPETSGTLDLFLTNPISRRRYVLERFAALVIQLLVIGVVAWLTVLAYNAALDMGATLTNVTAATAGLVLLGIVFGAVALAVGAATGKRSTVLVVTIVLAATTYLVRALGGQSEVVDALRWLSPFHYYLGSDPLRNGFDVVHLLVLAGIGAVLVLVGVLTFERRDVGV